MQNDWITSLGVGALTYILALICFYPIAFSAFRYYVAVSKVDDDGLRLFLDGLRFPFHAITGKPSELTFVMLRSYKPINHLVNMVMCSVPGLIAVIVYIRDISIHIYEPYRILADGGVIILNIVTLAIPWSFGRKLLKYEKRRG